MEPTGNRDPLILIIAIFLSQYVALCQELYIHDPNVV